MDCSFSDCCKLIKQKWETKCGRGLDPNAHYNAAMKRFVSECDQESAPVFPSIIYSHVLRNSSLHLKYGMQFWTPALIRDITTQEKVQNGPPYMCLRYDISATRSGRTISFSFRFDEEGCGGYHSKLLEGLCQSIPGNLSLITNREARGVILLHSQNKHSAILFGNISLVNHWNHLPN